MQDHRKLQIWRMACALAIDVRAAVSRFPKRGYAELKAQMISAAESIANTIVEGCGAESNKEFARFLSMSIKSNRELEGQLDLALGYRILAEQRWHELTQFTVLLRKKTYTLRKRALLSPSSGRPSGGSSRNPAAGKPRGDKWSPTPEPPTPNAEP